MSYFRVLSVIFAGLFVMLISAFGGYYWASQTPDRRDIQKAKAQETTEQQTAELETDDQTVDTDDLTPQNWEAFLKYEGERREMLGINKQYEGVNFRTGPGTTYSLRKTPGGGTLLMPIDRISNWFRARTRNGDIGWIHKSVVRQLDVPLPIYEKFQEDLPPLKESTKELIPEEFEKHNRVRVLEAKVNLRQGPGEQFAIAGRIYEHEEVRLFGKQGDWFRVKTINGLLGWVRSDLVEIAWKIPPEDQPTIEVLTAEPRMAPEYQFNQSGSKQEPLKAKLLEIQKPWILVKIDENSIGWVHDKEITQSIQSLIEQFSDRVGPRHQQPSSTDPRRPQTENPGPQVGRE